MTKPTKEELLKAISRFGGYRIDYGRYMIDNVACDRAFEEGERMWRKIEEMLDALYEDKP